MKGCKCFKVNESSCKVCGFKRWGDDKELRKEVKRIFVEARKKRYCK